MGAESHPVIMNAKINTSLVRHSGFRAGFHYRGFVIAGATTTFIVPIFFFSGGCFHAVLGELRRHPS